MLFNGGDCEQSFNVQESAGLFFCRDLNGGPPTSPGETVYITVTDTSGDIVYHSDFVGVGSHFVLSDGGRPFSDDQIITFYDRNDTSSSNYVLQSVQYQSSCASNLFLKDKFGSVQASQWENAVQGVVSCFASQTFDLDITAPLDLEDGPATLTQFTVAFNVKPFFFNLTDIVMGFELEAGETISFSINIPIDLTFLQTYNLLFSVFAETATGRVCRDTGIASFTTGASIPPQFPTFFPTVAPTSSSAGSPVLETEANSCSLSADIECRTSTGRSCRSVSAPDARICDSEGAVKSLGFQYTGQSCLVGDSLISNGRCRELDSGTNITQQQVYILLEDERNGAAFNGVVGPGDIIMVTPGVEREVLDIFIFSVNENTGGPGTEIQRVSDFTLDCNGESDRDLTLTQDIGALRVTSFETVEQGPISVFENFTVSYIVTNGGAAPAVLQSAFTTNPFVEGSQQLLPDSTQTLAAGESLTINSTSSINLEEASASNTEFRYDLYITGESIGSGLPCFDAANYAYRISSSP